MMNLGRRTCPPGSGAVPAVPIIGTGDEAWLVPYLLPTRLGVELPPCWVGPRIDTRGYAAARVLVTASTCSDAPGCGGVDVDVFASADEDGAFLAVDAAAIGESVHGVSWAWLPLDGARRFLRLTVAVETIATVGVLLELMRGNAQRPRGVRR